MGENPCNVICKNLVVSPNAILRLVLLKNPAPPVNQDDYIQQTIDAGSTEGLPIPSYFTRDHSRFKRPPWWLDGSPPIEDRVHKRTKRSSIPRVLGEVDRAGPGCPLRYLGWSVGGR